MLITGTSDTAGFVYGDLSPVFNITGVFILSFNVLSFISLKNLPITNFTLHNYSFKVNFKKARHSSHLLSAMLTEGDDINL